MENLFNNGSKQVNVQGNLSNTNAFKNMADNVIMGQSQMGQRLENYQKGGVSYDNFLLEQEFKDLRLKKMFSEQQSNNMGKNMNYQQHIDPQIMNKTNSINMQHQNIGMGMNNMYMNNMNQMGMQGVHPMLLQFNKNLSKEQDLLKETKENPEQQENPNEIYKDIIETMETQGKTDERYNKSEFLNFVKKLQSRELEMNDKENNVIENPQYQSKYDVLNNKIINHNPDFVNEDQKLDDIWDRIQKESEQVNH